jgi:Uma2 family endonuclease
MEEGSLPIRVRFEPVIEMTSDLFEQFSALNDDMRIELTAEGTIEIMPPLKGDAGAKEADLVIDLGNWARANGEGRVFGPNGTFTLPNGAVRMPDTSWVSNARYDALTDEEKNDYTPLCPDFVVELRSSSDRISVLQAKMEEYMANGAGCSTPCSGKHTSIAPAHSLRSWTIPKPCLPIPNSPASP